MHTIFLLLPIILFRTFTPITPLTTSYLISSKALSNHYIHTTLYTVFFLTSSLAFPLTLLTSKIFDSKSLIQIGILSQIIYYILLIKCKNTKKGKIILNIGVVLHGISTILSVSIKSIIFSAIFDYNNYISTIIDNNTEKLIDKDEYFKTFTISRKIVQIFTSIISQLLFNITSFEPIFFLTLFSLFISLCLSLFMNKNLLFSNINIKDLFKLKIYKDLLSNDLIYLSFIHVIESVLTLAFIIYSGNIFIERHKSQLTVNNRRSTVDSQQTLESRMVSEYRKLVTDDNKKMEEITKVSKVSDKMSRVIKCLIKPLEKILLLYLRAFNMLYKIHVTDIKDDVILFGYVDAGAKIVSIVASCIYCCFYERFINIVGNKKSINTLDLSVSSTEKTDLVATGNSILRQKISFLVLILLLLLISLYMYKTTSLTLTYTLFILGLSVANSIQMTVTPLTARVCKNNNHLPLLLTAIGFITSLIHSGVSLYCIFFSTVILKTDKNASSIYKRKGANQKILIYTIISTVFLVIAVVFGFIL
ncbi:hypothetical protein CDIK_0893 [Cucumispora dikerogammari]|nr:hypothetical protein CDIK_0893 [Cucumispora dikerogammari]